MQQGGGGSNKAQYEMSAAGANPNPMGMESSEQGGGGSGQLVVEEASPISSRPPASASAAVNLDELMPLQGDEVGDEADRAGGAAGGVGVGGGNRWPRQETLALLRIRSEMDAVFRDATLKGPLWEDVSRYPLFFSFLFIYYYYYYYFISIFISTFFLSSFLHFHFPDNRKKKKKSFSSLKRIVFRSLHRKLY